MVGSRGMVSRGTVGRDGGMIDGSGVVSGLRLNISGLGCMVSRCWWMVSRCRCMVSRLGSMIGGLILRINSFTFIRNISDITIFISGVAYNLNATVGKINSV
jgi:hypothetical protein